MDVLKAVTERVPFMCHQPARNVCHGWYASVVAIKQSEKVKGPLPVQTCPWEFSPPDEVTP